MGDHVERRRRGADVTLRLGDAFGRILVRLWLRTSDMSDPHLPRPDSPDLRPIPGHDADRVLLLGNGVTVGYGVLSHDLSLAGHLGRQLTRTTGRSTHVHVEADSTMTARTALDVAKSVDLDHFDGVVVTVGVNEVLALASVRRWERDIERLVEYILSPAAPVLQTFFVGVPRLRSVAAMPETVAWLTDRHAARLNAVLRTACESHTKMTFIPFDPDRGDDTGGYRSTEVYREWAGLIVEPIARGLSSDRPLVDEVGT